MGQQPRRGLKDAATALESGEEIPEELRHLAGPFGPWVKEDTFEFRHLNKDTQEWLARLSPEDVTDLKSAVSDFVRRQTIRKWLGRIFWAATAGFGAVYVAGERLVKFLQAIGGFGFDLTSIGAVLKGFFGS